jgi:hypothetical protein
MSTEQNQDMLTWWDQQSFPGKEQFKLEENGTLTLLQNINIKERVAATFSIENADFILKNLQEKFAAFEAKVAELEVEWIATEDKFKLADKVAAAKDSLNKASAIGDFARLALLIHDWEHTLYRLSEENYAAKLKITEQAEALAESDLWKETSQVFRDIAEKWRHSGYVDKSRNDRLWNRIEAARKTFLERKRRHQEEEEKDLLVNLDLKLDLVEQAESMAHSTEWKKTTEDYKRLTEEWKTIGHTLNKKNEELWQRFLAAKNIFFENKRQHYQQVQQEQDANYVLKTAIVEKAEALKDSEEWNVATRTYAALMDEWKKTGRVAPPRGDELWKRFTEAQEHFFEAKRRHTEEIRTEHENNYNLKKALLDRALELQYSNHWGEASAEMNELMEEWKKIGHVSREYSDKIWEEFNAARKNFFSRKDANREQRRQYAEDQKAARIAQAKGMVTKLQHDIKEEEEKIADFKNAIENITPGKKAAELKAHLEKLIEEGAHNIKRWQDKLALANEDNKASETEPVKEEKTVDSE